MSDGRRGAEHGQARRAGLLAPLACFAGTWALLAVFRAHAPLHLDTARDLLLARDCVLGEYCSGAGPRSSFGLMQGASWSHLLELREYLQWGLAAIEHAADLLVATAAAVVPLVARRIGASFQAITWALWLPATLLTIGYPRLWNPTPWPLALVCTFLLLLQAARTGGAFAFAAAAAVLALAVDVHVVSGLLVPLFVAVVVACARRPVVALVPSAAALVAVPALVSPGAFAENRALLLPHAPALVAALAVAALAGVAARRWCDDSQLRARRVAIAAVLYWLALMPLLAAISGHGLDPRYFAPIVTPAAIVLAARLDGRIGQTRKISPAVIRGGAVGLVVAGHVTLWAVERRIDPTLRLIEAAPIAAELYGRGLAFGDLYRHLRGPRAFDLVAVLAALEPVDGRAAGRLARDVLVVRARRDALPPAVPATWSVVELGGGHVAVIVDAGQGVRVDRVEVCGGDGGCEEVEVDVERFAQPPAAPWSARAHAGLPGLQRRFGGAAARYRLRRAARDGERQVVMFHDDCRRWQLDAEGPDALVFSVTPGPRCRWWLPPFAELDPRDEALAALVFAAGGRRPECS